MSAIAELLEISSPALGPETQAGSIVDAQLRDLLKVRNGFFALQNALWVFADESLLQLPGHNHPSISSWMDRYPETQGVSHAFAVDATGYPFVTSSQGILQMNLETGVFTKVADDMEGWARIILNRYAELTGWEICKAWQDANGALPDSARLLPRMPFVGGGKETVDNLIASPLPELIEYYAELAARIREMPEGGVLEIHLSPE